MVNQTFQSPSGTASPVYPVWPFGRPAELATPPALPEIAQARLLDAPMVSLSALEMDDANRLLDRWGHRLGPIHRPFTMQAFALEVDGDPVSVAVSASTVSDTVAGLLRTEVVECARLCAAPAVRWANRVMIRLWREVCAPRWPDWRPIAAISYSQNAHHSGDLYRFDGWHKMASNAGASSGGGAWTRKRHATDAVMGPKSLWLWPYQTVCPVPVRAKGIFMPRPTP